MQIMVEGNLVSAKVSWLTLYEEIIIRAATQWEIGILIQMGKSEGVVKQGGYSIQWEKLS
jgi:hypothetical protein